MKLRGSSTTRLQGETKGRDKWGLWKHSLRFSGFCRLENDGKMKKKGGGGGGKAVRENMDTSSKEACTVAVRCLHANLWQCGWLVTPCGNSLTVASPTSVSCAVRHFCHPQALSLKKKRGRRCTQKTLEYSLRTPLFSTCSKTNTRKPWKPTRHWQGAL